MLGPILAHPSAGTVTVISPSSSTRTITSPNGHLWFSVVVIFGDQTELKYHIRWRIFLNSHSEIGYYTLCPIKSVCIFGIHQAHSVSLHFSVTGSLTTLEVLNTFAGPHEWSIHKVCWTVFIGISWGSFFYAFQCNWTCGAVAPSFQLTEAPRASYRCRKLLGSQNS